ncbi:ATP-binding protein [Acinetobacter beijerinckii]|uniref:ATP-binding protein n=1 Tax=Acinetobacter beijerinckii TaxID=262668 RepID=UPI0030158D80
MKLVSLEIKNFRCYKDHIAINFDNLTTFIGKNDIGKSTILEALEIFFNNDAVKITQDDLNISSSDTDISITCEFSGLPNKIILDSGVETNLKDEFLLNENDNLKIKKVFDCSKKSVSTEVFIIAIHPSAAGFDNLLELKEVDLKKIIQANNIQSALKGNPLMRSAIWKSCPDLCLIQKEIPVSKPKEDIKKIWEQLEKYLPIFALFQSDRSSKDSDGEVQDPMKAAIATAISEVQDDIDKIQEKVKQRTEEIARKTHKALESIDKNLASQLTPQFTMPTNSKWVGLFNVGLNTDNIPLNKRGSGVRRLVLVSFFKAEAERLLNERSKQSIIYAIEEPETAQHPNNQKILQNAFLTLANEDNCQVLLTTHSPGFACDLPSDSIRFIKRDEFQKPMIEKGAEIFGEVANTLGIVPDNRVKVLICVEGPTDVKALKALSLALHRKDASLPNLYTDQSFAFVVTGGSTLKYWIDQQYLSGLGRKEFHLYDSDVTSYAAEVIKVNTRGDGSKGFITKKYEIESYLHSEAIKQAFDVDIEVLDQLNEQKKATPKLFAEAYSIKKNFDAVMGDSKAKILLADKAFPFMTADLIAQRDPEGEVEGWFRQMVGMYG